MPVFKLDALATLVGGPVRIVAADTDPERSSVDFDWPTARVNYTAGETAHARVALRDQWGNLRGVGKERHRLRLFVLPGGLSLVSLLRGASGASNCTNATNRTRSNCTCASPSRSSCLYRDWPAHRVTNDEGASATAGKGGAALRVDCEPPSVTVSISYASLATDHDKCDPCHLPVRSFLHVDP